MALMSSRQQQISGNSNSFNNNSFNNIVNFITGIDDEGHQILRWLSPLEPQQRHQGVRADRLDGVGNWVLETSEFMKWRDAEDGCVEQVLFCCGNPGVGKTYVSSLVIDSLCEQAGDKDVAVVGLYCDYLAQQEQSTTNMLGAMLKQLISRGGIPEHIREAFQKAKKKFGGQGLLLPEMVDILKKTITSLQRVYICIDALDESPPKHRRELLESLREIIRASSCTRVFLTGRSHIDEEIAKYFSKAIRIPLSSTHGDIESYLEMRLDGDTDPNAMDDELRADIMRIILDKVSEIFLLVSLNMDAILSEITLTRRRRKLDEMTKGDGLGGAYTETLLRMKAQPGSRSKLGMQVLMWVSYVERPLHVDELCHALGVEGSKDLDIRNIPAIETVLACSLGLVTIERSSSTIRLVHYTLQEYLSHNPNLFLKPHSLIAEVCLTYLNFRHVWNLSPALRSVPPTAPFIEYASCYWGTHARRETTGDVKALALKLLDRYDEHISSKILLLRGARSWEQPFDPEDIPRGFTGLHGAAYLGCVEIMVALLETNKWDVQATDLHGNTAITWAARWGHDEVVRILLERGDVNPDKAGKWNRTPLWLAAENGHEGAVRILLSRDDVNPDHTDQFGETPLFWAISNGHEGVVRMLLERSGINPETANTEYAQKLLLSAAKNGEEGMVKSLLERNDINPDEAGKWNRTPLWLAAENGHEAVVRILLARGDVNPDHADQFGESPLFWATRNGHQRVVRMLLNRNNVNPETADTGFGQQLLLSAAKNGEEGTVQSLLERNDINPDQAGKWNRTPLWLAAESGHEGVIRTLLARGEVNPDHVDQFGETPLFWAASNGHEGAVGILLEQGEVNFNRAANWGQTPLSQAVGNGHEGVVRMLLERSGINPETANTEYAQKLLLSAAKNGEEGMVKSLLERNDINPDEAGKWNRTPLWLAAENGHEAVVRMLLARGDVNPGHADQFGETPLFWATRNGHERVVRMLLNRSNVNPETADTGFGQQLLSSAAKSGEEGIVKTLLERNDINPDKVGKWNRTPLWLAAESGHEGVVRMLLARDEVNPDHVDQFGESPLFWAASNGHQGVVRMLLERGGVNPNKTNDWSQTLLSRAVNNGYEGVVRMLLERNSVDPGKVNKPGP